MLNNRDVFICVYFKIELTRICIAVTHKSQWEYLQQSIFVKLLLKIFNLPHVKCPLFKLFVTI